jgi:glycogen synthase
VTQFSLKSLRVAMCAWEIGRTQSGLGSKAGGLGVVLEELPPELIKAAARANLDLEIVTLSPCFGHYDRSRLTPLKELLPVSIYGHLFNMEAYEHTFTERIMIGGRAKTIRLKMVYFWDAGQLHWTSANALYPDDPQVGIKMFSSVSQAMAGYIRQNNFQTVHLHDYHVGMLPFYLGDEFLSRVPVHLTVHNASYQGDTPPIHGGPNALNALNLPGDRFFNNYFEHLGKLNLMKACMLRVHETDGVITTVSGDLQGSWGYAAELKQTQGEVFGRAWAQKGARPGNVFHPNQGLNVFERLPVLGITNGIGDQNRAENLRELKATHLRDLQESRGSKLLFNNPITQHEMLAQDHTFDVNQLNMKQRLRRLLHLEAFNQEPVGYPILFTAVGRMVEQKNMGLIADVIPRVLGYDNQAKFVVLASAPEGDHGGKATEEHFWRLSRIFPGQVYYNSGFNSALSKLILAGGDFLLVPSRFEPCGLVDYEAALVGTIPIARATGGLTKVREFGYTYEWLDTSDRAGEANALYWKIKEAIDVVRGDYGRHEALMRKAMTIDASWDSAADTYVQMYRCGMLARHWRGARREFAREFAGSLGRDRGNFKHFFGYGPHLDAYDTELRNLL